MSPIKQILYDHWKIVLTALLAAFLASAELTPLKLLSHHVLPVFGTWYITTIIVLSLTLIFALVKLLKNRSPGIIFLPPLLDSPRHKYPQSEQFIATAGVKWKVWLGYDWLAGGEDDQRVWVEGPYCVKCLYELDRDEARKKWHCLKCNEYIPILKHLREDTKQKLIKIFTADLERQKRNNLSSHS